MVNRGIASYFFPVLSDFISFHTFVEDIYETVHARVVIFFMQIDNSMLYCGIGPFAAYSLLYLSDFFSLHI